MSVWRSSVDLGRRRPIVRDVSLKLFRKTNDAVQLPRGITGFNVSTSVDVRAFRKTLYTAARISGFTVDNPPPDEHEMYHTLVRSLVSFRDEQWSLLLNIHHPYVAFSAPITDVCNFNFDFRDCEGLAANLFGYTVLSCEFLNSPVTKDSISLLGETEKYELKYWAPQTLGHVIFNFWD
ncbi:MAG: hypothetical protein AAF483_13570 [Planctomycetota bacterium]